MPVELRRKSDGSLKSKYWYGSYMLKGKRHVASLEIPVGGKVVPASLRVPSDDEKFEESRRKAQAALDAIIAEAREKLQPEEYVQKLHKIRTGRRIDSIPLTELSDAWDKAPRKRKGSKRYVDQAHTVFERFIGFIQDEYPGTDTLADVTSDMAEAFMLTERERGVSPRTCNAALILLRSAFKALANRANIVRNPFTGIPTLDENTTHRRPFNQEELDAISGAFGQHPFIRPVVVTGVCTAMRRGDCCTLRWEDVDLDERFVRVKTSKTGETVEIPMLAPLEDELRKHVNNGSEYVFPDLAQMYAKNPNGITYRVRALFEDAGFYDKAEDKKPPKKKKKVQKSKLAIQKEKTRKATLEARKKLKVVSPVERNRIVKEMFASIGSDEMTAEKLANMREAYDLSTAGGSLASISGKMDKVKSSIWKYLREIEERTTLRVLPLIEAKEKPTQIAAVSREREDGERRASIRDFHSFRVTWITLALTAGVPLELVQRVTGHKTTDVVLKHYFKPGREDFRKTIEGAMPKMLVGAPRDRDAKRELREKQEAYGEQKGSGELLEMALAKLAGVKTKRYEGELGEAVDLILKAKEWIDGHLVREASQ